METMIIIVGTALLCVLISCIINAGEKTMEINIRKWKKKYLETLKSENPGLEFNLSIQLLSFTDNQKVEIRKLLEWPEQIDFTFLDIISLLPKSIEVPLDFIGHGVLISEGEETVTFSLDFTSDLIPIYRKYGWEGAEDSVPYSELGDTEWWKEEGWKRVKPSIPETPEEGLIETLRFLIQTSKILKI